LKADIDGAAWRTEYERVLPQLKVQIRSDNKDWRGHIAEMTKLQVGIKGSMSETQVYLDKLHKEITSTLEKIDSREKYVNKQLDNIVTDYRMQQDSLGMSFASSASNCSLSSILSGWHARLDVSVEIRCLSPDVGRHHSSNAPSCDGGAVQAIEWHRHGADSEACESHRLTRCTQG
jgi:uncharacterized protein YhaN